MARPRTGSRSIASDTLTLRLTPEDRALLDRLVEIQAEEFADAGVEVTAASYVRGLIRREAKAKGLPLESSTTEARTTERSTVGAAKDEPTIDIDAVRASLVRAVEGGASQRQIAKLAKLDAGHLSKFKTGKEGLSPEALQRLVAVLESR